LFVGTSIIHPSTEGVFLLCNILDLLIYSLILCILSTYIDFFYLFPHFQVLWQAFLLIYIRLFLFFAPAYNSTNQCFFCKKSRKT